MNKQPFTVIGFYSDTWQRYLTHVMAPTADRAEQIVLENHAETLLNVVGTIAGHHDAATSECYVQESAAAREDADDDGGPCWTPGRLPFSG